MIRNYRIAQFGSLFSDGIEWAPSMTRAERRKFRQRIFRETLAQRISRLVADTRHLLVGGRDLPQTADFFFRSNSRNLRLIRRHLDRHHPATATIHQR